MNCKEKLKEIYREGDKKSISITMIIMCLSWAALPIIYLLVKSYFHKEEKEEEKKNA